MTTQTDREKAENWAFDLDKRLSQIQQANMPYTIAVEAYLAGAEAKDLEWQANVQELVSCLEYYADSTNFEAVNEGRNFNEDWVVEEYNKHTVSGDPIGTAAQQALTQFTSGQPAKGVMVPDGKWTSKQYREALIWLIKSQDLKAKIVYDMIMEQSKRIKGIGKDGGK